MTARLARLTIKLYPLAFQRRYGDELRALIEQRPPGVLGVLDLVRGAVIAHLRPPAAIAGQVSPADRVRASTGAVLLCWVAFAAAGFGFYKTTEDGPFSTAGHAHPLLGGAHLAIQLLAIAASIAVVAGAVPLIAAAVEHARDARRPALLAMPFVPLLVFAVLTVVLATVARGGPTHHQTGTTAAQVAFVVWGAVGLVCGIACAVACRAVLFAVPVGRRRLAVALASATFVTLAMFAIAAGTVVYAVSLAIDAARLSGSLNGPLQAITTGASLVVQAVVMTIAAALAATATRRGWRVAAQLDDGRQPPSARPASGAQG